MKTRSRFAARLNFEPLEPRAMLAADPGWAFGLGGPVFLSDVADAAVNIGPDDHLYVAGSFRSTVDFDPGPGTTQLVSNDNAQDGFIAKYTLEGALVWVKQFGQAIAPVGVGNEFSTGIEFDAAGNLYVSGWTNASAPQFGSTTLTGQGSWDAFVTKLDAASGNFLWTRGIGGSGDDRAHSLSVSESGDVYVMGSFQSTIDFDPDPTTSFTLTSAGDSDAYVWKLDSAGDFAWARQFSGPLNEFGHRVAVGNNGDVYAVGTFRDTTDFGEPGNPLVLTAPKSVEADIFIVKMDATSGNSLWARQATGPEHINAARVLVDGAGSLYVAGGFESTVNFGPGTPTLVADGATAVFVSKWDASGNLTWAETFASGPGDVTPRDLQLDQAGDLLFAINFEGTTDFDPGPQVANLTSAGGIDGAIVKLNSDGSFNWVRQVSGPGPTWAESVVADSAGNIYVSGFYEYSASLPTGHVITNPGTGLTHQPGNGQFLMKLALGDPPTKFYVVDDASANRTYEYQASGAAADNYSLHGGNSAPRGAASTAVGDRVWVIDANRKVFVYDINGSLLGSWTAGSMASNATPEGIATNGTDVWIIDSKSDKVFKYAGAASRLSGSQNAASSFNLNSGNRDPKDIVTDGASLWVVNDSTTDKVFKYTIAGELIGSWTIGSANSKPTGLTIDPANVSDIWIVDSGTDRIYQYTTAASRTTGSQTASATYTLAEGNSNPQGIADPPAAGAIRRATSLTYDLSKAHAAIIYNAFLSEVDVPMRPSDMATLKKGAAKLVCEQVFASFAPERNFVPASRTPWRVDNVGPNVVEFTDGNEIDRNAASNAFDLAFASIF